jgi:NhaA family Na+:H+ antiporter
MIIPNFVKIQNYMGKTIKTTPVEKWITNPVNNFISKSTTGGIVLFASALVAIFLANSQWAEWYHHIWEHKFGFSLDDNLYLNKTLHHWINDGLMAIFFFVVGLELKREIIGGELSNPKKAFLPIAAAAGGMFFPALIYIIFNNSGEAHAGWGIPMATDIAFALGVLYLLGDKIPVSLKIFLTALAIADDLGAVLVIAFFYTSNISMINLGIGLAFLLFLFLANRAGFRNPLFYGIVGIGGVWLFFLMSGVHATIAAVLLAFTIPADAKVDEDTYIDKINNYLDRFRKLDLNKAPTLTEEQLHVLDEVQLTTTNAIPPLQRLEHNLHPFVTFIIMPIFALANAGVTFSDNIIAEATSNVALGVALGLMIGKVIGVVGVSMLLIKLKIADFPKNMNFRHLLGVGFLASIGFTMSLFVTNLAFTHEEYILEAKIGIFIASLLSGIIGYIILSKSTSAQTQNIKL